VIAPGGYPCHDTIKLNQDLRPAENTEQMPNGPVDLTQPPARLASMGLQRLFELEQRAEKRVPKQVRMPHLRMEDFGQ
jgi:hypothetical protein